jgi:hypothetical protein
MRQAQNDTYLSILPLFSCEIIIALYQSVQGCVIIWYMQNTVNISGLAFTRTGTELKLLLAKDFEVLR